MRGSMFLYDKKMKSQQFKLVDKVKKSKIKELEYLEVGDIIEVTIPMSRVIITLSSVLDVTVNVVNKGTSFTVTQGKFASLMDVFKLEDA